MRYVITTVHGTHAKTARWVEADAPLGRYLREHLPGEVEIAPFRWSGRNGFAARDSAARALRDRLQRQVTEPGVAHFVIAHSHGGNVALLAAGDPMLQQKLAGIVALSTPFLQAWPRPLGTARIISAGSGVAILLANIAFILLRKRIDVNLAMAIVVPAFAAVNWAAMKLALRLADPRRITWRLPDFDPARLLIVRAAGDEASSLLGVVTLIGQAVSRVWAFAAKGAQLYGRAILEEETTPKPPPRRRSQLEVWYILSSAAFLVLAFVLCGLSLLPVVRTWITPSQATYVLVAAWVYFLPMVWRKVLALIVLGPIWWLSSILVGPVMLVLGIVALFFGPSLAFLHLFWEVSAEPTPPGAWSTVQLDSANLHTDDLVMMHGSLYNDPRAHSVIAQWIVKRAAQQTSELQV